MPPNIQLAFVKWKQQSETTLLFPVFLVIVGVLLFTSGYSQQVSQPPAPIVTSSTRVISPANDQRTTFQSSALPYSPPVSIDIPSIDVSSDLLHLGKQSSGSLEVPSRTNYDKAAWYDKSPSPGQLGASIIQGHVDFDGIGPAVFFNLGKLKFGNKIVVERSDGTVATFSVETINVYKKDMFPTDKIYGTTDVASLALITCGGELNRSRGEYDSNIVVIATLET